MYEHEAPMTRSTATATARTAATAHTAATAPAAHHLPPTARTTATASATYAASRSENCGGDGRGATQSISARVAGGTSSSGPSDQIGGGGGVDSAADLHPANGAFHGRGAIGHGQGMGASASARPRSGAAAADPAGEGGRIGGAEARFSPDSSSLGRSTRAAPAGGAPGSITAPREICDEESLVRWKVTYATFPGGNSPFLDGVLLLHRVIRRLVLLDRHESVVDSRDLLADDRTVPGSSIRFPKHLVLISTPVISTDSTSSNLRSEIVDFAAYPTKDHRWPVFFAVNQIARQMLFCKGTLMHRRAIDRLVLLDDHELVIDARYLKKGESISMGCWLELPGHIVHILQADEILPNLEPASGDCTIQNEIPPLRSGSEDKKKENSPVEGRDGPAVASMTQLGPSTVHDSPLKPPLDEQFRQREYSGVRRPTSHLDTLFKHFWSKSRVSLQPQESFQWWSGKVGGDLRSFAQVVASPPQDRSDSHIQSRAMGERGGRYPGGRGGMGGRNIPGGGGGKFNNKWQRNFPEGSGQNSGEELEGKNQSRERWENAAQKQGSGNLNLGKEAMVAAPRSGQPPLNSGKAAAKLPGPGNTDPCFNCNMVGHFAASCPTIRCDRCKKLGHIREICQAVLPWECVASLCAFQAPGQGFFYFPDACAGKFVKEKVTSVIITVLEGNPTFRDIETEFNEYFGAGWRCTARVMSPTQFTMRFPNAKEVERTCYFGKRMEMKTFDGVINVAPWSVAAGAKAQMHKAWVKIRNIPPEKRCEATAAYAGSLVGVSLEIDLATLFKPEFCRVLIGCRNIHDLPESAEGMLGDYLYDFYYEIDSILVGGHPRNANAISVDSQSRPPVPSPKRARFDNSSNMNVSNSSSSFNADGSQSDYRSGNNYTQHLSTVSEHESEEDSDEDQGLLIEQLAREGQHGDKIMMETQAPIFGSDAQESVDVRAENNLQESENRSLIPYDGHGSVERELSPPNDKSTWIVAKAWAPVTPVVQQENISPVTSGHVLSNGEWPPLVQISEVDTASSSSPVIPSEYLVQSPENSPSEVVTHDVKNLPVDGEARFGTRNQEQKMAKVTEQAAKISKKRNLEGMYEEEDQMAIRMGAEQLVMKAKEMSKTETSNENMRARRPTAQLLLTDG